MVHQGDEAKIKNGGIKHKKEIIRIPPAIKKVRGHRQPGEPQRSLPQCEKDRQHHQQEDQECPGVEQHLREDNNVRSKGRESEIS